MGDDELAKEIKTLTDKVAALEESRNAINTWLKVAVILAGILGIGGGFLSSKVGHLTEQVTQAELKIKEGIEKATTDLNSKVTSLTGDLHKAGEDFKKDKDEALSALQTKLQRLGEDVDQSQSKCRKDADAAVAELKTRITSLEGDLERSEGELKQRKEAALTELNARAGELQIGMSKTVSAKCDEIAERALTDLRNRANSLKTDDLVLKNVKASGNLSVDGAFTVKGSPLVVGGSVTIKRSTTKTGGIRLPQIGVPSGNVDNWIIFASLREFAIPAGRVAVSTDAGLTPHPSGKGWMVEPSVRDSAGGITQEGTVDYILVPRTVGR